VPTVERGLRVEFFWRMAMAGAIVGLKVAGVEVDDIGATTKTLPDFPGLWAHMLTTREDHGM